MNEQVREFLTFANPQIYIKNDYEIYYSHEKKYHWVCLVQEPNSDELKFFKIDFEFADMEEFLDKIIEKINRGQSL